MAKKESILERIRDLEADIAENMKDSVGEGIDITKKKFGQMKDRAVDMKDEAMEYASENPEKSFLLGAALGAVFALGMKSWMSHKKG